MTVVWLNGTVMDGSEARLDVHDRGFTLADGVFETVLVAGDEPVWLAEHLRRLRDGAGLFGVDIPFHDDALAEGISRLLAATRFPRSAVRISVSRGAVAERGLFPRAAAETAPTCLLTVAPASHAGTAQRMIVCRTTRRNELSPLSRIKSSNYGDNILARREALARGADDALMLNTHGHMACATVGNVFFRIDGRWKTPRLDDGVLAGLARRRFLRELDAEEVTLTAGETSRTDAAFICNSLGCLPIGSIDGNPLAARLHDLPLASIYRA